MGLPDKDIISAMKIYNIRMLNIITNPMTAYLPYPVDFPMYESTIPHTYQPIAGFITNISIVTDMININIGLSNISIIFSL